MTDSTPNLDTLDTALRNQNSTSSSTNASTTSTDSNYAPPTKAPAPTPVPTPRNAADTSSSTGLNSTRTFPHNDKLDKKDQMKRLEHDIRKLLFWKNPVQSGAYFILIIGGLILSKSYSLIQIISALLTVVTAVNLVYVNVTIQTQRILADRPGVNPYSALLQKDDMATMDRSFLQRNTELVADVVEAFLQRLSRIVLIENTISSVKWLAFFYIVWKLSAIISVRALATLGTLLLFTVPLFYTRNQTCVDAKLLQVQAIGQTHLEQVQHKTQELWHQCLTRFKLAQPGTGNKSGPSTSTTAAAPAGSRKED